MWLGWFADVEMDLGDAGMQIPAVRGIDAVLPLAWPHSASNGPLARSVLCFEPRLDGNGSMGSPPGTHPQFQKAPPRLVRDSQSRERGKRPWLGWVG